LDGDRTWRTYVSWIVTGLAILLVLFALIGPNQLGHLKPAAILRIPIEGLVGLALLVVLPVPRAGGSPRPSSARCSASGAMKIADLGFYLAFNGRFDPVDRLAVLPALRWDFVYAPSGRSARSSTVVGGGSSVACPSGGVGRCCD
jgi:hypothetical protein